MIIDGEPGDEDAVLMKTVFDLPEPYAAMSPVHIPRGFTKALHRRRRGGGPGGADPGGAAALRRPRHLADRGHRATRASGAVVGLSNARVASMLRAPAVIVSEGGVGRPIDEIVLNASHFAAHGVPVAGAIVNKVRVDEQPGIERTLERGLALPRDPAPGRAAVPADPVQPDARHGPRGVHGPGRSAPGPDLDRVIDGVAIGAMEPHHMLERVGPGTLVIVPGDREDAILTLAAAHLAGRRPRRAVEHLETLVDETPGAIDAGPEGKALGIVLTGGYEPRPEVLAAVRHADMFAAIVPEDTYTVASEVHDLLVKTHPADTGKIELIKELVWEHLKMDRFLEVAAEARFD